MGQWQPARQCRQNRQQWQIGSSVEFGSVGLLATPRVESAVKSRHNKDFANSTDALLAWQSFLFENQLSYFKDHVYLKSNYWNEIREMSVFFFKFKLLWSKAQHTSFNTCSPLIILYFENRNWLIKRSKWLFPWFFVSILISDLGYIFWWSVMRWPYVNFKKQDAQVRTRAFIKKGFFLALILLACLITSSLIHEVTTLMEKLFKLWERHLSVQIAYLIEKGF